MIDFHVDESMNDRLLIILTTYVKQHSISMPPARLTLQSTKNTYCNKSSDQPLNLQAHLSRQPFNTELHSTGLLLRLDMLSQQYHVVVICSSVFYNFIKIPQAICFVFLGAYSCIFAVAVS